LVLIGKFQIAVSQCRSIILEPNLVVQNMLVDEIAMNPPMSLFSVLILQGSGESNLLKASDDVMKHVHLGSEPALRIDGLTDPVKRQAGGF
jgi:hypothetical protein